MTENKNFPGDATVELDKYKGEGSVILLISSCKIQKLYIARTRQPHRYAKKIRQWMKNKEAGDKSGSRFIDAAKSTNVEDWAFEVFTHKLLESDIRNSMPDYEVINDLPFRSKPHHPYSTTVILLEHKKTGFKYLFANKKGLDKMSRASPPRTVYEKIFQVHHGITDKQLVGPFSPMRGKIEEIFNHLTDFNLCPEQFKFSIDDKLSAMSATDRIRAVRRKNVQLFTDWVNGN